MEQWQPVVPEAEMIHGLQPPSPGQHENIMTWVAYNPGKEKNIMTALAITFLAIGFFSLLLAAREHFTGVGLVFLIGAIVSVGALISCHNVAKPIRAELDRFREKSYLVLWGSATEVKTNSPSVNCVVKYKSPFGQILEQPLVVRPEEVQEGSSLLLVLVRYKTGETVGKKVYALTPFMMTIKGAKARLIEPTVK